MGDFKDKAGEDLVCSVRRELDDIVSSGGLDRLLGSRMKIGESGVGYNQSSLYLSKAGDLLVEGNLNLYNGDYEVVCSGDFSDVVVEYGLTPEGIRKVREDFGI